MSWIQKGKPGFVLAPMEGVTDYPMRALMTEIGGFSHCVSEFVRVSQEIPPAHVFRRHVPELAKGATTASGAPVQVQILGGDPEKMALTAQAAVRSGAKAIDINFGCPAPTVNRHDGGATLLKSPCRIEEVVGAVRKALPSFIPVSAKLRLGWESIDDIDENAKRAEAGGASWITVHGRTRLQGYSPPAHWEPIGRAQRALSIPVVANGDIWTQEDFRRCSEVTGCEHFMLGRAALANPFLASGGDGEISLETWLGLLRRFEELSQGFFDQPGYVLRRMKQWLRMAANRKTFLWFDAIKRCETLDELYRALEGYQPIEASSVLSDSSAPHWSFPSPLPAASSVNVSTSSCGNQTSR